MEKECWPRPVGYSTAITSYETLHFQTLKGDSRVKQPIILRYAPILQQILSNVRTGVAGAAVVSGRVELKDGFMSFFCFFFYAHFTGGEANGLVLSVVERCSEEVTT